MTQLIVRRMDGSAIDPDRHALVAAALDKAIAGSQYTYDDAMLAGDELLAHSEAEKELAFAAEAIGDGEAFNQADLPVPEPDFEQRLSLYECMRFAADQAAGEEVYFFRIPDGADPANYF